MHSTIRSFVVSASLALSTAIAPAAVLSFDDIVGDDGYGAVPVDYGGLDWSAAGWSAFTGDAAPYTPHSGAGRATMGFGGDDAASTIRFLSPTVFQGAWFSGYEEATVRFDLYLAGQRVASSATMPLSETPAFLDAGWGGAIDAVMVSSSFHAFYAMDDFSFGPRSTVPEPATVALVLAGLGLAGFAGRRRS